jgi:endogenous inhibitor of DNA gyrase (YacG/DUF329 family)
VIRQPTCPICSKAIVQDDVRGSKVFPFCSERCRQVDLLRWSLGKYAIVEPLDPLQLDPLQIDPEISDVPE